MSPVHQVWPKPSCKAQWKGEEDKADRGRGGKITSGIGQAWSSAGPTGQWRTGENGENWLWNHLWCPSDMALWNKAHQRADSVLPARERRRRRSEKRLKFVSCFTIWTYWAVNRSRGSIIHWFIWGVHLICFGHNYHRVITTYVYCQVWPYGFENC